MISLQSSVWSCLENILGKEIADNGGKADWKRKKTNEKCNENV